MSRLKVDLHDIYSDGKKLDATLHEIIQDALDMKASSVEIITGKGSGALKKSVIRFLEKNYKQDYHRLEKDSKNWGRIFVHFR